MHIKSLLYTSLVLMLPLLAEAGTVTFVQGVPGDNNDLPPTAASPAYSTVITFAGLLTSTQIENCQNNYPTACPTFSSSTYASQGVTISSPDGLLTIPFSDQTAGGNEVYDEGAGGDLDGTANITVSLAGGVEDLAVGLADSDSPVTLTINALDQNGNVIASQDESLAVEAAAADSIAGDTYFVARDTTPGIYGLQILQTTQTDGSGLALAEVEFSPEPSTFLLLIGGGLAVIGSSRLRRKA